MTDAPEDKPADSSAKADRWQSNWMESKGNEGVAELLAPLPTLNDPELLKSLRSRPSTVDDGSFLVSDNLEFKRRSDLVTQLSSTAVLASSPRDASMVTLTMSRDIFEKYFRRNYLRTNREFLKGSLARSVAGAPKTGERRRARGLR
jgi:hypothetical protein